ncbi:MAG: hypothetical protein OXH57_12685 [Ekhidna sp.]|nr:hypothetical protein [Ekhidna sp.]
MSLANTTAMDRSVTYYIYGDDSGRYVSVFCDAGGDAGGAGA